MNKSDTFRFLYLIKFLDYGPKLFVAAHISNHIIKHDHSGFIQALTDLHLPEVKTQS